MQSLSNNYQEYRFNQWILYLITNHSRSLRSSALQSHRAFHEFQLAYLINSSTVEQILVRVSGRRSKRSQNMPLPPT